MQFACLANELQCVSIQHLATVCLSMKWQAPAGDTTGFKTASDKQQRKLPLIHTIQRSEDCICVPSVQV